jgi:hypothetical protein
MVEVVRIRDLGYRLRESHQVRNDRIQRVGFAVGVRDAYDRRLDSTPKLLVHFERSRFGGGVPLK